MISNFFKKNFTQNVIARILRAYLDFALKTTKWQFDIDSQAYPLLTCQNGQTALVVFWHENLIAGSPLWGWALSYNPDLQFYVLISRNRDGQLITKIINPWGIRAVQGSSRKNGQDKGGTAAFRELLKLSKAGHIIAITPDGPRGPRRHLNSGIIKLALLSKIKIVPVGASCRSIRLNSWDKLVVPLPFGKGRIVCSRPITVNKENYDQMSDVVTSALNLATDKAQQ